MGNIFEQIDNKLLSMKLEQAIEMLKTKSPEEIKGRLAKVDRAELMKKIGELDKNKIRSMNIDTNKIKQSITDADVEKIKAVAGKDSDAVIAKMKELLGG